MEVNIYMYVMSVLCLEYHIAAKDKKFTDGTNLI